MLANMFDPSTETNEHWAEDIHDDVIEECQPHGGCVHVYVDRESASGNVYVKASSVNAAVNSVNALHGRWFAGEYTLYGASRAKFLIVYKLTRFLAGMWVSKHLFRIQNYCVPAGKVITANYIPVPNYHQLFPEAQKNMRVLRPAHATQSMPSGNEANDVY
jgi:hypothetical protein